MTPLVIILPDDLQAFLDSEVAAKGYRNANAYIGALLRDARDRSVAARLDALLLDGFGTEALPLGKAIRDLRGGDAGDDAPEGAFIHQAAVTDVTTHYERYVAQGVTAIAQRFLAAIDRAVAVPQTGTAHPSDAAALAGMRCIPLKGFSDHDLYVRESAGRTTILRVLHRKRDLLASLQSPEP